MCSVFQDSNDASLSSRQGARVCADLLVMPSVHCTYCQCNPPIPITTPFSAIPHALSRHGHPKEPRPKPNERPVLGDESLQMFQLYQTAAIGRGRQRRDSEPQFGNFKASLRPPSNHGVAIPIGLPAGGLDGWLLRMGRRERRRRVEPQIGISIQTRPTCSQPSCSVTWETTETARPTANGSCCLAGGCMAGHDKSSVAHGGACGAGQDGVQHEMDRLHGFLESIMAEVD